MRKTWVRFQGETDLIASISSLYPRIPSGIPETSFERPYSPKYLMQSKSDGPRTVPRVQFPLHWRKIDAIAMLRPRRQRVHLQVSGALWV